MKRKQVSIKPKNITDDTILDSSWSTAVANDPKHRPQSLDKPSTTVRREWCRRPQEAHLLDKDRYRRLSVAEIARIQGFDPTWVDISGISEIDRIAALGNAVPPPLSSAIGKIIEKHHKFHTKTLIEICAGIGGLSYGFEYLKPLALIEMWNIACKILRSGKRWSSENVIEGKLQDFDFSLHKGEVGLLCGGPPCQPWSHAGHQQGASDSRDVMELTPSLIAACEPEVFLFENVPGLVTAKQHKDYLDDLLGKLATPSKGLNYGVAIGILNAADFGVPQIRRRVFILGFKNKSFNFASNVFKAIQASATHRDPDKLSIGKKPWVTLKEALDGIPVTEQWRRYNGEIESKEGELGTTENQNGINEDHIIRQDSIENKSAQYASEHITLLWPGKGGKAFVRENKWIIEPPGKMKSKRALLFGDKIGDGKGPGGMAIIGDYTDGLEALSPFLQGSASVVYFDSHRIDVLDVQSAPGQSHAVWLSIVKNVAEAAMKCMQSTGVFILHADEKASHYGRMVLDEVFGHEHHITTFAWQKKYAPQNDFTKNTPTDAFDYLIVYSKCHRDLIPKVALTVRPDDIIDDGDPRGCFTAGHKGARSGSENTKFKVNAPPYRWEIVESHLPKGVNQWFDKYSGVLWYESVEEAGSFWLKVRVTDAKGNSGDGKIEFKIKEKTKPSERFVMPNYIWWLLDDKNDIKKGGTLRVLSSKSVSGLKGCPYSLVLRASGGKPFVGKSKAPGKGRYWEFADYTLIKAIAEGSVYYGSKGIALPSIKHYHSRDNAEIKMAVLNWLPYEDYGKAEDATRHLKDLAERKLIHSEINRIAKPEKLLYHLIQLFAPNDGDVVVSFGDPNASMASVASKMGKFSVHITGTTSADIDWWEKTAKRRLLAVLRMKDPGGICDPEVLEGFKQKEPGPIGIYSISKSVIEYDSLGAVIKFIKSEKEDVSDIYAGFIGCSRQWGTSPYYGGLFNRVAYVLSKGAVLDNILISQVVDGFESGIRLYILYEQSEVGDEPSLLSDVQVIHAPYELIGRVGI